MTVQTHGTYHTRSILKRQYIPRHNTVTGTLIICIEEV